MRWPELVPRALARTDIQVTVHADGMDEDGAPVTAVNWAGKCNWQGSAQLIRTDDTHTVQLTGVALIPGDIAPDGAELSGGTVAVCGQERRIFRGTRERNPDGTVNYTRLEVV